MTDQLPIPQDPGHGASRPDWFITGYRQDGMFIVAGSTKLESAELVVKYFEKPPVHDGPFTFYERSEGQYTFTAVTELTSRSEHKGDILVMAWGHDYREALARLFEHWAPDGADPMAIREGG